MAISALVSFGTCAQSGFCATFFIRGIRLLRELNLFRRLFSGGIIDLLESSPKVHISFKNFLEFFSGEWHTIGFGIAGGDFFVNLKCPLIEYHLYRFSRRPPTDSPRTVCYRPASGG